MKLPLLVALVVPMMAIHAQAKDAEKAKLRVLNVTDTGTNPRDCRLTQKEIKKIADKTSLDKRICSKVMDASSGRELSMTELKTLLQQEKVRIEFEGKEAGALLGLLNVWKTALTTTAFEAAARLPENEPWTFAAVSSDVKTLTVSMTSSATKEVVTFKVAMGATIPKKVDE